MAGGNGLFEFRDAALVSELLSNEIVELAAFGVGRRDNKGILFA